VKTLDDVDDNKNKENCQSLIRWVSGWTPRVVNVTTDAQLHMCTCETIVDRNGCIHICWLLLHNKGGTGLYTVYSIIRQFIVAAIMFV